MVINISIMSAFDSQSFPTMVRTLLEISCVVVCGRNIGADTKRLERPEVNCDLKVELRTLMQELDLIASTSLATLAQRLLGMNLDKELQDDDYLQDPIPFRNCRFAALDALVSRKCAKKK